MNSRIQCCALRKLVLEALKKFASLACLLVFVAQGSGRTVAAEITWEAPPEGEFLVGTIRLKGLVQEGDHEKFLKALGDNEGQGKGYNLIVQLDSKGGSFEEGIKIASVVKDKNLSTRHRRRRMFVRMLHHFYGREELQQ